MRALIAAAMDRSRTTLLLFLFLLLGGMAAYQAIPKESNPDVTIPMIYVSMTLEGISPEDGERLLVRPMEQELRSLEGIKEMRGTASEGHASVMLEFDAGFDPDKALQDVREKVDTARSKLPQEADEPRVNEINVSLFPVLSVGLSGPLSERELITIARRLQDAIEAIPEVLEVEIGGDREDLLEIVVDPQVLESYGIDFESEVAVITDDVPMGASAEQASGHIKLLMLVNDVSLRNLIPGELAKGFGFFSSKPSSAFSPVAITPDELGAAWDGAKLHLPLTTHLNSELFGQPSCGVDMTFDFPTIVAHAAKTRPLSAGCIVGSGTISNYDRSAGSSCLAEKRMLEIIADGKASTEFMKFGDNVRIEMFDESGDSIFGAIEQTVVEYKG